MSAPVSGSALPGSARAARDTAEAWLAHLARDRRGLPVPWVNRWGAESAEATRIEHDPVVGQLALFHDDHGEVPDFTRQNIGRQRAAMMGGLCQVCGRPVPWSRRNLVVSSVSCERIDYTDPDTGRRGAAIAVAEPWLDDRCAAIATLLCPALIRRTHVEDLRVVPVRAQRHATPVLSVGRFDLAALAGPRDPQALQRLRPHAGRTVAMWVKAILTTQGIAVRDGRPPAGGAHPPTCVCRPCLGKAAQP